MYPLYSELFTKLILSNYFTFILCFRNCYTLEYEWNKSRIYIFKQTNLSCSIFPWYERPYLTLMLWKQIPIYATNVRFVTYLAICISIKLNYDIKQKQSRKYYLILWTYCLLKSWKALASISQVTLLKIRGLYLVILISLLSCKPKCENENNFII